MNLPRLSLLLVAPLALCLMGADSPRPYTRSRIVESEEGSLSNAYAAVQLIEIGGCQYVLAQVRGSYAGVSIVHHAACTNPAHNRAPSTP